MLTCNNLSCNKPIQDYILITTCSHIFCHSCSPPLKEQKYCLACKESISFIEKKLKTDKNNLIESLIGYNLFDIFKLLKVPINFIDFQYSMKFDILNNENFYLKNNLNEFKRKFEDLELKCKLEVKRYKRRIKSLKDELEREREKVYDLTNKLREQEEEY